MNLLSEIISKPVLNLYSGKIEGTVKDAIFDSAYKKIQCLKIFDNEEEEYTLSCAKIYNIGSSSLVIKNSEALQLEMDSNKIDENNPINFEVFSSNGDNLGKLLDIELENNLEVRNFITTTGTIPQSNILNISKIIIVNNTDKKIKCSDFKPKIKVGNFDKNNVIKIFPIESNEVSNFESFYNIQNIGKQENNFIPKQNLIKIDNTKQISTPQENIKLPDNISQYDKSKGAFKISTTPTPQRVVGNGNFLIGRKVIKTIYGINNEIIIRKDSIINAKNLENAKKHSKLVELTVYSKIKA